MNSNLIQYKFILYILFIISLGSLNSLAFDFSGYEQKIKTFDYYNFSNPPEIQKEKDYYGNYIKNLYYSGLAFKRDEPYQFSIQDKFRVVKDKTNFELKYYVGPVLTVTNKDINFFCFQNLPAIRIDERFYEIPLMADLKTDKPILIPNNYRILNSNGVYKNLTPNFPEKNYRYFDFQEGELKVLDANTVRNKEFSLCIESLNDQYPTNNKESLDITYRTSLEDSKEEVHQMIRRSYFGTNTTPDIEIAKENERTQSLIKTDNKIAEQSKPVSNKIQEFVFFVLPIVLLFTIPIYFLTRFILTKLRQDRIDQIIKEIK
jgi:hypothetical protein